MDKQNNLFIAIWPAILSLVGSMATLIAIYCVFGYKTYKDKSCADSSERPSDPSDPAITDTQLSEIYYDFSAARFMLDYRILVLLFVLLLFYVGLNHSPYNSQYALNFNITMLLGFCYLGFEMVLAYLCIFSGSLSTYTLRVVCGVTMIICIAEGIATAIFIDSAFGTLFSFQIIVTDFASLYSSIYLMMFGKMRKHIAILLLIQIVHFVFRLSSLSSDFVYVHNDVVKPQGVQWVWPLLVSAPKLLPATEIVIDKLRYVAETMFYDKCIQIDPRKQQINQIVFVALNVTVFAVCVIVYSAASHWNAHENEVNGYYPFGVYLDFVSYLNWPLVFLVLLWVCCSRVYVKRGGCKRKREGDKQSTENTVRSDSNSLKLP
eukprot:1050992_1